MRGKGIRSDSKVGANFNQIVEDYAKGFSTTEIGIKFGIDASNIYRVLKMWGIKLRTRAESTRLAHARGRGNKRGRWKGGIGHHTQGYILIRAKDHPRADSRGYVPEHILVMEKSIGHPLLSDEQVHHLNRKRDDNRPENLVVMKTRDHRALHGKETKNLIWQK